MKPIPRFLGALALLVPALLPAQAQEKAPKLKGLDWWAFQSPDPASLKAVRNLDEAVAAGLREHGLEGSPPADRRTLIRRVTFDLTGLPPTPEAVAAFVADESPHAYVRLVDDLLASPRYGEKWARHWLDVARYSDTKGYVYAREEAKFVHAALYRDWVVKAFNDDLPYDRFVLLQLAADQLVAENSPDLAAMGFLTLGRRFLGVTHDIIDDRIDVTMQGFQGITVSCARCHDHKYDPVSIRDYYALYGVFNSCEDRLVPCDGGHAHGDAAFAEGLRTRREKLAETMATRREEQSARVRATVKEHLLAQTELDKYPEAIFGQLLDPQDINPTFVRKWQASLKTAAERRDPIFAVWNACVDLPAEGFAERAAQVIHELAEVHPRIREAFATPPADLAEVAARHGALFSAVEQEWQVHRKMHPEATALPDARAEELRQVLHGPQSPCHVPDEGIVNIELYFPNGVISELWRLQSELDRWLIRQPGATAHANILVDRAEPVTPRVFLRGNPQTKGEPVPRAFPAHWAPGGKAPFDAGSGRLELAKAIADRRNPLTARVMVNRVWAHVFGRGLVPTPNDLGTRSALPSHPELLDWLAVRFMDEGWSVKRLVRELVLSHTYRQGSAGPRDPAHIARALERDPENRLLWRALPHRLGFEEMRDAWLMAGGELNLAAGGKPEPVFAATNFRRTLYAEVDREKLPEALRTFDFANPDLTIACRAETTVPQQALFGLNHPFAASRARALVHRLEGPDASRVETLYQRLYQRAPSSSETAEALAFIVTSPTSAEPQAGTKEWTYGYGEWDEAEGRIKSFTPLPHFNGTAWQGGENWPDGKLGWLQLTAEGGHPGNDLAHAVVRRWTAPRRGVYGVRSLLIHEPKPGDGIRAFISHSGRGLLRSSTLHAARAELNVPALAFEAGDTLDFVVDIRKELNSDQFLWAPAISLADAANDGEIPAPVAWDAGRDFAGTSTTKLTPWEQLAQMLLLSNEFLFVD